MKKLLLTSITTTVLALSLSACGSGSKDDVDALLSSAPTPPTLPDGGTITGNGGQTTNGGGRKLTPAQRESLTKVRECMLKKGYHMPEVNPTNPVMAPKNNNGKSDTQVNKDAEECAAQSQPSGG